MASGLKTRLGIFTKTKCLFIKVVLINGTDLSGLIQRHNFLCTKGIHVCAFSGLKERERERGAYQ